MEVKKEISWKGASDGKNSEERERAHELWEKRSECPAYRSYDID